MTNFWSNEDAPSITVFKDAENAGAVSVAKSLAAEIKVAFGERNETPLSIVARAADEIVGGLNGATHWGWCYIRHLWVREDWRRRGIGARLLAEAEVLARARHCVGLYVDTFDAGAADFYERTGFTLFGSIGGFPPGHTRSFLKKNLAATMA